MTSYPCNKYGQITPSYLLSVKYIIDQHHARGLSPFIALLISFDSYFKICNSLSSVCQLYTFFQLLTFKEVFYYEIYAGISKAAHKVFQQRVCLLYRELSLVQLTCSSLHRSYSSRFGVSSIRNVSLIRHITTIVHTSPYRRVCRKT